MQLIKISSREKWLIYAAVAVVLLSLFFFWEEDMTPDQDEFTNSLDYKRRMLLRYRQTLASEENYKSQLEQYRRRLNETESLFLAGDSPAIAGAELQKLLKEIADENGVEITRRDIQREKKVENEVTKISVRIVTNPAPDQLVQLLAAIQNYEKQLIVDEITINALKVRKVERIRPTITVAAYVAPKAEAPPEGGSGSAVAESQGGL